MTSYYSVWYNFTMNFPPDDKLRIYLGAAMGALGGAGAGLGLAIGLTSLANLMVFGLGCAIFGSIVGVADAARVRAARHQNSTSFQLDLREIPRRGFLPGLAICLLPFWSQPATGKMAMVLLGLIGGGFYRYRFPAPPESLEPLPAPPSPEPVEQRADSVETRQQAESQAAPSGAIGVGFWLARCLQGLVIVAWFMTALLLTNIILRTTTSCSDSLSAACSWESSLSSSWPGVSPASALA